ncbi:heme peroxidase [Rickenella mellea]|uniref:Heme peroxidase n=1 Tax=Rickenella mellea TaxID=50990 RepID=A0A4Y7PVE3_9AGAM|nr:heme peroxidase [Rickenella mellea]
MHDVNGIMDMRTASTDTDMGRHQTPAARPGKWEEEEARRSIALAINDLFIYSSAYQYKVRWRRIVRTTNSSRARLVNCGFFIQVILSDYIGAIWGLVRDGLSWRLDPLSPMRKISHEPSPRGAGNMASIESNLLYRWHATLSRHDTTPNGRKGSLGSCGPPPTGAPLQRSTTTGRFADADLAAILQNATDKRAGALRARGIPAVLRVVEVMGIEQSRSWGACSLNEFRKFMGLKPCGSFKEWNPDPEIYTAAKALYEDIDNLELHVGMQDEAAKPVVPGSGLCPGFTISRTILADCRGVDEGRSDAAH